jgi:hypothetical protein
MQPDRLADVKRFYEILDLLEAKLGGKRILADCNGKMEWPQHGVYFFFEPGEYRTTSGSGLRVVRVGTHGLKRNSQSTLWKRLRQHRGTLKSGGGNHRASVFRLHVGLALIQRDRLTTAGAETWGKSSSAKRHIREQESPLEQAVSQHIRSMPFLWMAINDEPGPGSLRGYVELNAIALLSNYNSSNTGIDLPGQNWLGRWSASAQIRNSGLWNVNYVDKVCDTRFLETLESLL